MFPFLVDYSFDFLLKTLSSFDFLKFLCSLGPFVAYVPCLNAAT